MSTNRAFQFSAELNLRKTVEDTFRYNVDLIYNGWLKNSWCKRKCPRLILPLEIPKDFSKKIDDIKVEIFRRGDENFCFQIEEPDQNVMRRMWTTESEILSSGKKVLIGVKISYTTPEIADYDKNIFSVPGFIRSVLDKNGVKDVRELGQSILEADSEDGLNKLYKLVSDAGRLFPVVVVTGAEGEYDAWTETRMFAEEILNRVFPVAHVAYIPFNRTMKWKELVGKDWDVYNGAIRTYYKDVDFNDESDIYRHPLFTARKIEAQRYLTVDGKEKTGRDAFLELLVEKIRNNDTRMRIDWKGRGHKFLKAAQRNAELAMIRSHADEMNSVEKTWEELFKEERDRFEEERALWEEEKRELENDYLEADEKSKQQEKELAVCKGKINQLQFFIEDLKQKLSAAGKVEEIIPLESECTYDKISEWVKQYFPNSLYLTKNAEGTLKDAADPKKSAYEDVSLVYKWLQFLGNEYWQNRMGLLDFDVLKNKAAALGIYKIDEPPVSETQKGEQGDEYTVNYKGKKHYMEFHIKKGTRRDPRHCLRIYYFWDDEDNCVVIGELPFHLDTRNT